MGKEKHETEFPEISHLQKRAYLAALVENAGKKGEAALAAGVSRRTPNSQPWKDDKVYQAALADAMGLAGDKLEAEAIRRACEGVEEPVGWYQGKSGGTVTRYSDTLLIFLMKGANPEKYADRHRHSGGDGPPIEHAVTVTRTIIHPDDPADDS